MTPTRAQRPLLHPGLFMLLLFLEALGALCLLLFIVWWTMFSGRDKGELPRSQDRDEDPPNPPPTP